MKNLRAYYSDSLSAFKRESVEKILGIIHENDKSAQTRLEQNATWKEEIEILKQQMSGLKDGRILFEYTIPRMGKRADVVILYENIIFVLEFKCGAREYKQSTYDQVYDYALDLRNFQKESHDKLIVPVMVCTHAPDVPITLSEKNRILEPLRCNQRTIARAIERVARHYAAEKPFDYLKWEESTYLPTPTIIEAAQALYRGHDVEEITRSEAGAENLSVTTKAIDKIIDESRRAHKKSICFVTGVPGAGKTLVGLNLAVERAQAKRGESAVFLSGNFPLVEVLQEALAQDKVEREREHGVKITKDEARRSTSAFIQMIHHYRDSFVNNRDIPPEHVVIFDEAQRAWTKDCIQKFMRTKKGISDFDYSEPEFLISTMNRHNDWAVIICLVGGGQEINTGEAGLPAWFEALRHRFRNWDVYVAPEIKDEEYRLGQSWQQMTAGLHLKECPALHLTTSIRSFRTPDLANFVKALLDVDRERAKELYTRINDQYPIRITRDLGKAKDWVKAQCQGTTRYGLLASSGGLRLKPEGIFVKNSIKPSHWFLKGKEDVRSSYALEDVVTEFDVQGLEIDYSLVAWDNDFRFDGKNWVYKRFRANRWENIQDKEKQLYIKNAYRVLLTRARQGMVIFVPKGSAADPTRKPEDYDRTYAYLKEIGIEELK